MRMVDQLAQRYGQHPTAIIEGDTYVFRMINTLDAFGLLNPSAPVADRFPDFDDDPTGLAGLTETLDG